MILRVFSLELFVTRNALVFCDGARFLQKDSDGTIKGCICGIYFCFCN